MDRDVNRPRGLNTLSTQIFELLARYTMFPWPVLKTQCERAGIDPFHLTPADLDEQLLDKLAAGVARFTSPAKGAEVRGELAALAGTASRRASYLARSST
jgi:hypothetical protein